MPKKMFQQEIKTGADSLPFISDIEKKLENFDKSLHKDIDKAISSYETRLSFFCLSLCKIVNAEISIHKNGVVWNPLKKCKMIELPGYILIELNRHKDKVDFRIYFDETKKEFRRKIFSNKVDF